MTLPLWVPYVGTIAAATFSIMNDVDRRARLRFDWNRMLIRGRQLRALYESFPPNPVGGEYVTLSGDDLRAMKRKSQ
jgi:hypothetical protein